VVVGRDLDADRAWAQQATETAGAFLQIIDLILEHDAGIGRQPINNTLPEPSLNLLTVGRIQKNLHGALLSDLVDLVERFTSCENAKPVRIVWQTSGYLSA
jgi:hypothetical protein